MMPIDKARTRIISQDREYEDNVSFLLAVPEVAGDIYQAAQDIQNILNIDESKNLDLIGRVVGVRRFHEDIPLSGRSLGNKACVMGNKYAMCKAATWDNAKNLSDEIYRMVLKSKVVKNNSDATIMDTERGVSSFVTSSNVRVIDGQDMTFRLVFIGLLSAVERYVIDNYDIIPRPSGVKFMGFTQTSLSPMMGKSFVCCGNRKAQCMTLTQRGII